MTIDLITPGPVCELNTKSTGKRNLHQISVLRMAASLMVCLYHLASGNSNFLSPKNPILKVCSFGYLGVQIFFIISGFIICYSLPANYQLKDLKIFLKKRIIRVEPPYLLSILLTLSVAYIASLVTHNPIIFSFKMLLLHLGYVSNFTNSGYINGVYWTLGIEFQFYLMIGLLFVLMNRSVYIFTLVIITFLILSHVNIPDTNLILPQLPLFCIGILMYFINYRADYPRAVLWLLLFSALVITFLNKPEIFFISLFTVIVISIPLRKSKTVTFLSTISYSLYLTHIPIGGRIINLSVRFVKNDTQRYLVIATAFIISIIVAYLFYILIERWTTALSKKIHYKLAD